MKALKLNGRYSSCFRFGQSGFVDLMKPLPDSFKNIPWKDMTNKTIKNQNVILSRYGDIYPFKNGPIFECDTLFLDCCDKNFLAYWLTRNTFPKLQKLYVGSHPCHGYTLCELMPLKNDEYKKISAYNEIYVIETFYNYYKNRWWSDIDNIKSITDSDFKKEMESYDSEELLLKE